MKWILFVVVGIGAVVFTVFALVYILAGNWQMAVIYALLATGCAIPMMK